MNKKNEIKQSITDMIKPDYDSNWEFKVGDHVSINIDKLEAESVIANKINKILNIKSNEFFIISKKNYFKLGFLYKFCFIIDGIVYDLIVDSSHLKKTPLNILITHYEKIEEYEMCEKLISSNNYE